MITFFFGAVHFYNKKKEKKKKRKQYRCGDSPPPPPDTLKFQHPTKKNPLYHRVIYNSMPYIALLRKLLPETDLSGVCVK